MKRLSGTRTMSMHTYPHNLRPNQQKKLPPTIRASLLLIIQLMIISAYLAKCSQLNESSGSSYPQVLRSLKSGANDDASIENKNSSSRNLQHRHDDDNKSVADLRLKADFRAAKLRWIYKRDQEMAKNRTMNEHRQQQPQQPQVEPASFEVRFCELTSWSAEIKCRHREMLVGTNLTTDNSVITPPPGATSQLQQLTILSRNSEFIEYEAQIFDLRALTNYTFHVRVLKFNDNGDQSLDHQQDLLQPNRLPMSSAKSDRSSLARRLTDRPSTSTTNELFGRVETKPFRAEATKCLADVSEVVITTGKYFGGRITVEDSLDRRCHLFGNKSSEQTSYTFKIDHEICHSKVVNGNRIETMILVHENKDILTHNTARFLVLCNFLQKSFTLRASISLPKVNGIMGSRPAVITPLNGRPSYKTEQAVLLGSMPGVFRAKPVESNASSLLDLNLNENRSSTNELDISSNVEKNAINKVELRQRQPKGLIHGQRSVQQLRSRSMDLAQSDSTLQVPLQVPEPVQIQSKLLHVERHPVANLVIAKINPSLAITNSSTTTSEGPIDRPARLMKLEDLLQARREQLTALDDKAEESIILTNNHRVAGDYRPTSSLRLATDILGDGGHSTPDDGGFSIKYSGANINEYSIARHQGERSPGFLRQLPVGGESKPANQSSTMATMTTTTTTMPMRQGERTGRMQNIMDPTRDRLLASLTNDTFGVVALTDRRMGDMIDSGDLLAETSNNESETIAANQSPFNRAVPSGGGGDITINGDHQLSNSNLAQNLTNYLLKWSLKTLTNLAKKSLESLANRTTATRGDSSSNDEFSLTESSEAEVAPLSGVELLHTLKPSHDRQSGQPVIGQQALARTTTATTRGTTITTTAAAKTTTVRPPHSSQVKSDGPTSDGFVTHLLQQRVHAQTPNVSTSRAPQLTPVTLIPANSSHTARHQQNHIRPSNYSKSLDLDRAETSAAAKARQLLGHPIKATSVADLARDPSGRSHEDSSNHHLRQDLSRGELGPSLSWLLVGCLLVLTLVVGLLAILCLVSTSSPSSYPFQSQLGGSGGAHVTPSQTVLPKTVSHCLPRLVFNGRPTMAATGGAGDQYFNRNATGHMDILSGYEEYDYNRFKNNQPMDVPGSREDGASCSSGSNATTATNHHGSSSSCGSDTDGDSNNGLMLGNKQTQQLQSAHLRLPTTAICSLGSTTTTTRSTSTIAGLSVPDESNCNNSELLLSEHVLMSTNPRANESYA